MTAYKKAHIVWGLNELAKPIFNRGVYPLPLSFLTTKTTTQ